MIIHDVAIVPRLFYAVAFLLHEFSLRKVLLVLDIVQDDCLLPTHVRAKILQALLEFFDVSMRDRFVIH